MPYFEASQFVQDTVTSLETGVTTYRKYILLVDATNRRSAAQKAYHTPLGNWDFTEETSKHSAPFQGVTTTEVEVPF